MFRPGPLGEGRPQPQSPRRQAFCLLMTGAMKVPQVCSTVEVEMSRTIAARDELCDQFRRQTGEKLGLDLTDLTDLTDGQRAAGMS